MPDVVQGLVGCREDLGFYPEGGGSPGKAVGRGRRDLTQMLPGDLWQLQGGQTTERGGWEPARGDSW